VEARLDEDAVGTARAEAGAEKASLAQQLHEVARLEGGLHRG
jgi:hypothetical protein